MSGLRTLFLARWRQQGDRRILHLFALYGLAAGILTYFSSFDYEAIPDNIGFLINFPAFLALFIFDGFIASLGSSFSILAGQHVGATIILGSVITWSLIGLILYGLYKMFKLGP